MGKFKTLTPEQNLERYKKACNNMRCDKIADLNTIDDITACMVNCQFSYDYDERKQSN